MSDCTQFDGRMYCPLEDFLIHHEDGSMTAMTRGHRIEITRDGLLQIIDKRTGRMEFET